jgi:hypothetical protein
MDLSDLRSILIQILPVKEISYSVAQRLSRLKIPLNEGISF